MKKISILLSLLLVVIIGCSVFACVPNDTTNEPPINDNNNNGDGFIDGSATIEEFTTELVKTLISTAKTASSTRLNATNPCVSWHVGLDLEINQRKYDLVFEINYDNRDKSLTEIRILMYRTGESLPYLTCYYFADEPIENKTPGNMYLEYGDAKVVIPLVDTFLGDLFPIQFEGLETEEDIKLVSGVISANIFTIGNIKYKYKDESDGKRTRNYSLQIDLKKTLMNVVNLINIGGEETEFSTSIEWIIESVFGVDAKKISTQLPNTSVVLNMTTTGGSKTILGTGTLSNCSINIEAAASDYKDSIFRGESFSASIALNEFVASTALIKDFPKEDNAMFNEYIRYNETALVVEGSLMFNGNEDELYTIKMGVFYDGLAESQVNDELMIVVQQKNDPNAKYVEFYAFDNKAYLNFLSADGKWVELNFEFDVDEFIEEMIRLGGDNTSSMDFIKTLAYILGSFQLWEDGSLSFKVNAEFFKGVLNVDAKRLADALQYAYTCANGSGIICADQILAQLGSDVTMEDILSGMVIDNELLIILDKGDESFDTTNDLIDETIFN